MDGSVHSADSGFQFQGCRWGSTHGTPRNPGEPYHHPMMVPPVPEHAVLCQAGAGNLTGFVRRRLLSAEAAVCFTRDSHSALQSNTPNEKCHLLSVSSLGDRFGSLAARHPRPGRIVGHRTSPTTVHAGEPRPTRSPRPGTLLGLFPTGPRVVTGVQRLASHNP